MSKFGLKVGQNFMMMGILGGGGDFVCLKDVVKFVEDMIEVEQVQQVGVILVGLVNLGNICYFNLILQILKVIFEFQDVFKIYKFNILEFMGNMINMDLVFQLVIFYKQMGQSIDLFFFMSFLIVF